MSTPLTRHEISQVRRRAAEKGNAVINFHFEPRDGKRRAFGSESGARLRCVHAVIMNQIDSNGHLRDVREARKGRTA